MQSLILKLFFSYSPSLLITEFSVYPRLWIQNWPVFSFFKWNSFITTWLSNFFKGNMYGSRFLSFHLLYLINMRISQDDLISEFNFWIMLQEPHYNGEIAHKCLKSTNLEERSLYIIIIILICKMRSMNLMASKISLGSNITPD